MNEDLRHSSAATTQRNMMTIPRLADGRARHARGWHMVAWSSEVRPGQVIAKDYFSQRIAIFRGEDGKVKALEAFCPHLGADLSAGCVKGNDIVCPFHKWQFSGSGECTDIPYTDKIPPKARTRAYPVLEINDTILVWHDPEYGEPEYDVPVAPEYDMADWTPGWVKRKIRIKTHAREVIENIVDKAHLLPIHDFCVDDWHPIWNRHISGEITWGTHTRLAADAVGDKLYVKNLTYGPAYQYTWQKQNSGMFDSLILTAWCPVDENTLDYWFGVTVKSNIPGLTRSQAREAAEMYADETYNAFLEDVYIWERKLFRPEPLLCAGDGPIAKLRKWYTQFYTDRAQVDNELFADNGNQDVSIHDIVKDPLQALGLKKAG